MAIIRREKSKAKREAKKAEVSLVLPTLYPYQIEAAEFHLKHKYSLNCSEMGVGKSFMALEAARRANLPTAVFGPAFLEHTWINEAAKMGVKIKFFSYSQLIKLSPTSVAEYKFWIADEAHYLQTPTAKRTLAFLDLLTATIPDYLVELTGTPIRNRVPGLWTLLAFASMCPEDTNGRRLSGKIKSFYGFANYFCHFSEMFIYGRSVKKYLGIREEKIADLKLLLQDKFIKFTVDQVLKDLPEITRKHVDLGFSPSKEMLELFEEYQKSPKANIQAKAASALLKAPKTAAYCLDIINEAVGPIIIFTDHVESAKYIHSQIEGSVLCTGQVPTPVRMGIVKKFQEGGYPAIVATIGSLSVGVTLTAARHVIFNDMSWTPADNQQAEKRIHRIGQKSACFAHYIHGSQTDFHIYRLLEEKLKAIEAAV